MSATVILHPDQLTSYMRQAIAACRAGIAAGQTPFGCAIVTPEGQVIAAHNTVWKTTDITAHAEITCLRQACASLGRIDLSGCALFSTTEPCPMCAAASHWARIGTIYFGATIDDADKAGFHELAMPCSELLKTSETRVVGGVLSEECRMLFDEWKRQSGSRPY